MNGGNGNGVNKVVWYLISSLTLVALSLVGGWAATTSARVDELDKRVQFLERQYEAINAKLDILVERVQ